jgi:RNA methyltransferase, TrmH family, group 1
MSLDNIRIVLVGTTHPGNIGFAARAMKTMALSRLELVAPARFPDPQAEANATHGNDVLQAARVHAELAPALAGARLVAGFTARTRRMSGPSLALREFAELAVRASARGPVALVFGRENTGLTNAELDMCQYTVHIPSNPEFGVLNLAFAVQVAAYELFLASGQAPAVAAEEGEPPAPVEHLEGFYRHLERVLDQTGFLHRHNGELLMRRLRHLFNRARPDSVEVDVLRGMLAAIEARLTR